MMIGRFAQPHHETRSKRCACRAISIHTKFVATLAVDVDLRQRIIITAHAALRYFNQIGSRYNFS